MRFYILLARGGRGPLCGIGVMSLMLNIAKPLAFNDLTEDSLPAPTPFTRTCTSRRPNPWALATASLTITVAAYGVAFFGPLKPQCPADDHDKTLPLISVRVTIVLLMAMFYRGHLPDIAVLKGQ